MSLMSDGNWGLQKMEHNNLDFVDMLLGSVGVSHPMASSYALLQLSAPTPPNELAFLIPSRLSKSVLYFHQ